MLDLSPPCYVRWHCAQMVQEGGIVASENAEVVPLEDLLPPFGSTARGDSGVMCNRHPLVYLPHVPFTLQLPDKRDEN